MLDIEMNGHILSIFCGRSPRRGAWIEIYGEGVFAIRVRVAPRVGERGLKSHLRYVRKHSLHVAPRVGERGLK